jgi:hypothetical protein
MRMASSTRARQGIPSRCPANNFVETWPRKNVTAPFSVGSSLQNSSVPRSVSLCCTCYRFAPTIAARHSISSQLFCSQRVVREEMPTELLRLIAERTRAGHEQGSAPRLGTPVRAGKPRVSNGMVNNGGWLPFDTGGTWERVTSAVIQVAAVDDPIGPNHKLYRETPTWGRTCGGGRRQTEQGRMAHRASDLSSNKSQEIVTLAPHVRQKGGLDPCDQR